ncbi:Vegetative incompatibility protein HET-E-1 [Colletotrichum aenigma]|uniref:Vegetative incompatibility protein HET-E-1 n=1 Tax=Colletotrichum aenigma TaxID=1215731 RepID=UPI0018724408|nr:Vegetative incompatibility protein HET-E-1 [Colletotrichum aenigma]KAF5521760.1 Vegetative incompatibility protein HET-E-1 [Colletotrichum aenigma]
MWLINTKTLRLEQIVDPSSVDYAILSHTWGDDEVSFKDMKRLPKAMKRTGFVKIAKTCKLALKQDLRYAWIDTCCIDKTSSAELSEAINAIKKLYDISEMASCKWFSRGWTLQELIAPANIRFYDANWNFRFTKENNVSTLATITTIDVDVLKMVKRLKDVLVAVKMSWAANRETTRPEDIAYCLLGVFDINMPMLYGEGEKAFQRLQENIASLHLDTSIFAWLAPFRPPLPTQSFRGLFATSPQQFASSGHISREVVVDPEDSEALEGFASKPIEIRKGFKTSHLAAWPGTAWNRCTFNFCGDALSDDFCGLLYISPVDLKPLRLALVINKLVNKDMDVRFFYDDPADSHWGIVGDPREEGILRYARMGLKELSKEYSTMKSSHLYGRKASVLFKCNCSPEEGDNNTKVEAVVNELVITISLSTWSSAVEEVEEASDHESDGATSSQSHDMPFRKRKAVLPEPDGERKPRWSKRLERKKW